jgi:hypothetical protein
MTKPTLNVCLRNKRIYLNRVTITQLGDPSHLRFWYDEGEHLLYVSATSKDDLYAYEIPKYFWKSPRSCVVARIAFLTALQYRLQWKNDSRYSYTGTLIEREGFQTIAFKMNEGRIIMKIPGHTESGHQSGTGRDSTDVGDAGELSRSSQEIA